MLSTYQSPYRVSLLAGAILVLTILQGTSATLTFAVKSPFASGFAVTMVTLIWLLMYVTAFVGLLTSSGINWVSWLMRYRLPLTLLLAGTAFSAMWSLDARLTTERSIHLIGSTLIALYLGFSLPLTRLLKLSAITLGVLMLLSVFFATVIPAYGLDAYEGRLVWSGVMTSKNTLGFWAAVTMLLTASLAFWHVTTLQRLSYLFLFLAASVCLVFSVSATSWLALLVAGIAMIYLHVAFSLRLGLLAMSILGIIACALAALAFSMINTAELIGRSGDLTGRGEVWTQTWNLILERPLTGFGYGTVWYPTDATVWIQQSLTDFSWTVYHAHNGLLQIASEVGLPLTALAVFMILQQVVEIVYCQYQRQQPGVLFVFGFTLALLLSNYSEARLLVNRELYWIFFIALPVSMLQQVTLRHWHSGGDFSVLSANTTEKMKNVRTQLQFRRQLKNKLKKRRKIKVINETSAESPIEPDQTASTANQDHRNLVNIKKKPLIQKHAPDSTTNHLEIVNRKQARRNRKTG